MNFDLFRAVPGRLAITEDSRMPCARPDRRGFRHDGESSPLARWLAASLLPLAALALSTAAQANTLTVSASIQAACSVTTTNNLLSFGTYSSTMGDLIEDGTFSISCTEGANVRVRLGPGQNPNGTVRNMQRTEGSGMLGYNLYTNAAATTPWGDDTSFGSAVVVTSFEQSNHGNYQVFGKITGGQSSPPGNYSDTVAITLMVQ